VGVEGLGRCPVDALVEELLLPGADVGREPVRSFVRALPPRVDRRGQPRPRRAGRLIFPLLLRAGRVCLGEQLVR